MSEVPDTFYLSLGENCLPDNILRRHGLETFSTVYSSGRSNIDYALHLESEDYAYLLSQKYLYYDHVGAAKVVRNRRYSKADDIYEALQSNGFEFTHHDVIADA